MVLYNLSFKDNLKENYDNFKDNFDRFFNFSYFNSILTFVLYDGYFHFVLLRSCKSLLDVTSVEPNKQYSS